MPETVIEEHAEFKIVDVSDGHSRLPLRMLETKCAGTCDKPYRIDKDHQEYQHVMGRLRLGDRSVIFCYHKSLTRPFR